MVFQQLTEAKSEIKTLQEKLRMETERNIRLDTFREETISLEREYYPHTENISVSDSEITLTAPCLKTCKEIQIPETAQLISLHDAFADSASAILLRLQMTSIAYLCINRTPLSYDSVHSIVDVLQKLKALRLSNVCLPPTSLSYILNALLTNESLQEFTIQFDDQMMLPLSSASAGFYAQAISNIIRSNSTLQYISILGLRLGEAGVGKILLALAKDNKTLRLLTLDLSHQDTAYRFAEANGPIKDRLSFS
ncbi:PREDICTED: uncharacterized protein LOC109585538 [Amphimedon queenslandica]|uniref:Uncharacterized protein n=1 Tax=Amphimedon queenslandica TaxID=400682 RepID=A0AAN0JKJ1_AMPQE|nr:PREDICTED: uncharacterized protein LOC109585538 [Amphimedon queenslandica]|eukprot:XP_019857223.1 PREDICTED: uncharacterized protein LOC109585538 [Amphimedon queenslandica]